VLIVGGAARSIGLYAAGVAVAMGSSEVDYMDHDGERLEIAGRKPNPNPQGNHVVNQERPRERRPLSHHRRCQC
jgi:hypothetical protein